MNTLNTLHEHTITICPPFHDVDSMFVVWHGNYVRYFEVARCALLKCYDYDYPAMQASGWLWPVVDMRIKYVKPLRYDQAVLVTARISEYENRLKISYLIKDAASGDKLTEGYTIQVAVDAQSGEMAFVSPAVLLEKLGVPQ